MAKYIRYALATICLAASVGCLALWWRSDKLLAVTYLGTHHEFEVASDFGFASVYANQISSGRRLAEWRLTAIDAWEAPWFADELEVQGRFGGDGGAVYFPLWYPALIFALAGVASLRHGRRFTLRSAIIATTVVAGLLEMAISL
jgi:hypothetical protein